MRVHPLRGPSLDFCVHNGKTEASILVILYVHLLALSLEGDAMQRSLRVFFFFFFLLICHKTYLLHLNVPRERVRASACVHSHSGLD